MQKELITVPREGKPNVLFWFLTTSTVPGFSMFTDDVCMSVERGTDAGMSCPLLLTPLSHDHCYAHSCKTKAW